MQSIEKRCVKEKLKTKKNIEAIEMSDNYY